MVGTEYVASLLRCGQFLARDQQRFGVGFLAVDHR
jgi:hypothetical protein